MFLLEKRLCVLKAEIKVTISYREEKLQKITEIQFFIHSNGPVRKDTGEIETAQKNKQSRDFHVS
jgi:hypothetical protein